MWDRAEFANFDSLCLALVMGRSIPSVPRQPGVSPSIQGLALGWNQQTLDYGPQHVINCEWIPEEAKKLAKAVHKGLESIVDEVTELGHGKGKDGEAKAPPFVLGLWGWHVAHTWTEHLLEGKIHFGPMAAWFHKEGWSFEVINGETVPARGLECKPSSQVC